MKRTPILLALALAVALGGSLIAVTGRRSISRAERRWLQVFIGVETRDPWT